MENMGDMDDSWERLFKPIIKRNGLLMDISNDPKLVNSMMKFSSSATESW